MKHSVIIWLAMAIFGLMLSQLAQASENQHCNNVEYKLLEDQFLDLLPLKRQRFFELDKMCMLELGLDKDDIVERRTIFLMGSMNYEHYGELD